MSKLRETLEQNKLEIIDHYNNGKSLQIIADKFNCYIGSIYIFLKDNKISKRKDTQNKGIINILNLNKDKIIQHYINNKSMKILSKEFGCGIMTLYTFIRNNNIIKRKQIYYSRKRIYKLNDRFFQNIDNEYKAYWMGFLAADGCVFIKEEISKWNVSLVLKESDKPHIQKFLDHLDANYPIRHREKTKSCGVTFSSRVMCSDLINIGITPRKTFTLQFPKLRDDLVRHFVRGFFDGDGCVYTHKGRNFPYCSFVGQPEFLTGLQDKLKEIGIERPIYKRNEKAGKINTLQICKKDHIVILYNWMYKDANIYLDRKYNRFKEYM